jgi:hypothetical protein
MTYLLFTCGLVLSAVAAYYSIMGLIAIFSTAAISIAIMGSILEASKLVSASWLYRNWKTAPKLLLTYFTTAVVVLMLLTSMGIFGYLSKAHLDQAVPTGDVVAKLAIIDEKIKTERENIDVARKSISQLDSQVDQTLARSKDERGASNSVAIRQRQAKERATLLSEIQRSQAEIAKLNQERAPVASELRKVEAEVGPIKYIAALIYDDQVDDTLIEKSVRIVILMIVFVFDPLAVLLLIAANRELLQRKKNYEPDDGPLTEEQIEQVKETVQSDEGTLVVEPDEDRWKYIVDSIHKNPTKKKEPVWEIPSPPAEPPEEFRKVVKEYFDKPEATKEQMLYVNEEPEKTFVLNPDFDQKDPFLEKDKLIPVRPNSRRDPPA